jgi:hypothetical protein
MAAVFTTSDITNKKSAGAMRALQANAVMRIQSAFENAGSASSITTPGRDWSSARRARSIGSRSLLVSEWIVLASAH